MINNLKYLVLLLANSKAEEIIMNLTDPVVLIPNSGKFFYVTLDYDPLNYGTLSL